MIYVSLLLDVLTIAAIAGGAFLIMKALQDRSADTGGGANGSSDSDSFRDRMLDASLHLTSETDDIICEFLDLRHLIIKEDLRGAVEHAQRLKGSVMRLEAGRERVIAWYTPACTLHGHTDKLVKLRKLYGDYIGETMLRLGKAIDNAVSELQLADQGRTSNLLSDSSESPLSVIDKSLGGLILNGDHENKILDKSKIHTLPAAKRRFLDALAREIGVS